MAIITAAAKVSAHVAAFGRVKPSQFEDSGPIQSIKFVSMDGTKEHWATFPAEQAKTFTMGQHCNLIPTQRRGKDTFDIEPLDLPPQPQIPARQPLGFQASPAPTTYAAPVSYQQPAQQQPVQALGLTKPRSPHGLPGKRSYTPSARVRRSPPCLTG